MKKKILNPVSRQLLGIKKKKNSQLKRLEALLEHEQKKRRSRIHDDPILIDSAPAAGINDNINDIPDDDDDDDYSDIESDESPHRGKRVRIEASAAARIK